MEFSTKEIFFGFVKEKMEQKAFRNLLPQD